MSTHTITIHDGPCNEQRHAGEACRERWFTCTCYSARRLDMLTKRHDADDKNAIEWNYQSAREHVLEHSGATV